MNIVITGEGIVSAIGLDKHRVLESLQQGRTGIRTMTHLRSTHRELPVGEVALSNADMQAMLHLDPKEEVSRTTLMGILSVREALEDAFQVQGIFKEKASTAERAAKPSLTGEGAANPSSTGEGATEHIFGGKRIVLISGTTVGGMDITERHYSSLKTSDEHIDCLRRHDCGSCTQEIADYFGIFADCTTLSTACSSAANALVLGANLLRAGLADIVVAGGTEALTLFHLNGFNSLMILDHDICRPFDATRAGLNLGEGAAYVVMEREEGARARNADIHAYLSGYGNACDAFHQTASSENGEGAYLAMRQALDMARVSPGDIEYVNAHGTGTPNNDQSESVALRRLFGDALPAVSSTKSFTGHTTSASGGIEAVICLLALRHRFIPANLGWAHPMPDGIIPSTGQEDVTLTHVLCNSFGFGGNDTSLLLSAEAPREPLEPIESHAPIRELARVEITDEESIREIKEFVSVMEARRMGKLLKSSLLTSLKALRQAGLERPDAIITATRLGCLENSERLLDQMEAEGEVMVKPTYFMQSTHNTLSSNIAIRTQSHGYNATYTHGGRSLEWALQDARLLLSSGMCKTVLVGLHDESTPTYRALQERLGETPSPAIHSLSILLTCGK